MTIKACTSQRAIDGISWLRLCAQLALPYADTLMSPLEHKPMFAVAVLLQRTKLKQCTDGGGP